jgi:hypothetical protein
MTISSQAAQAREAARHQDGRFGETAHGEGVFTADQTYHEEFVRNFGEQTEQLARSISEQILGDYKPEYDEDGFDQYGFDADGLDADGLGRAERFLEDCVDVEVSAGLDGNFRKASYTLAVGGPNYRMSSDGYLCGVWGGVETEAYVGKNAVETLDDYTDEMWSSRVSVVGW